MSEENKSSFQELVNKGQDLYNKQDIEGAVKLYKSALLMSKDIDSVSLANTYIRIANAYYKLDDKDKSSYYYEKYLELCPAGQVSVFSRLAFYYYYIDADKCIDYHNKALNCEMNLYNSASKVFAMTKSDSYSQQDIKDETEYEAEQVRHFLFKNIKKYNHYDKKLNPERKLNIGYLSSDCRAHTMMNYMLPIWESHNKDEFNFFIFNGSETADATTEKIRNTGIEMVDCAKMSPEEIAKLIYDKEIDILIDLGGFTHIKTFAMLFKPAPVIMSYLGYLNTLGMPEVDYIITDRFTIPEDKAYLYTEKPLYIDKGYQIFTRKNIPDVKPCPFKENGYITFGSFNCSSKFNDTTFFMWAKILQQMPDSKLLIYRTKMTLSVIKSIKSKFEKLGIPQERLQFNNKPYTPHHNAYSFADISLDTFPFSGMSIAIETALMGVPTISLVGEGMQSRGAGRINHILGLDEFNTTYGDEYIKKAVALASDLNRLEELRNTLREKVFNSELKQNPADFTKNLEEKYKEAWKNFINSP